MQIGIAGAGKEEEAGTEGRTLQEGRGEWRCALSAESGWLKGERREAREGGGERALDEKADALLCMVGGVGGGSSKGQAGVEVAAREHKLVGRCDGLCLWLPSRRFASSRSEQRRDS